MYVSLSSPVDRLLPCAPPPSLPRPSRLPCYVQFRQTFVRVVDLFARSRCTCVPRFPVTFSHAVFAPRRAIDPARWPKALCTVSRDL